VSWDAPAKPILVSSFVAATKGGVYVSALCIPTLLFIPTEI